MASAADSGKNGDDNDAQPDASAAATTTATTTMNSTPAHHTANVAATCATLAPSKRLRRNPLL
jgi:hypothetical protein